jgi:hypothetical protein
VNKRLLPASRGIISDCRFYRGANHAVIPEPTDEANRCKRGHLTPKVLQKALYVGFFGSGRLLQVVWRDGTQFPVPEVILAA